MISAGTKLRHWQPTNIQMTRKASKMQPVIGPILAMAKGARVVRKSHQLDPKSAAALVALGQISAEMKDFVSARKYYEEALKLEPNGQYAQTAKAALQKLKKK
jgi:Tetratricopeptide repeat.